MEDFQRGKDIQGSIDGTMGANDLEKRIEKLEEGFRKIEKESQEEEFYNLIGRIGEINRSREREGY